MDRRGDGAIIPMGLGLANHPSNGKKVVVHISRGRGGLAQYSLI